jgi:hypothetical protein
VWRFHFPTERLWKRKGCQKIKWIKIRSGRSAPRKEYDDRFAALDEAWQANNLSPSQ